MKLEHATKSMRPCGLSLPTWYSAKDRDWSSSWFCFFVTLGKLICYFTCFHVLKFCLWYLLRWSRIHSLACCSTHAQHPLHRDPGYTALTFTWYISLKEHSGRRTWRNWTQQNNHWVLIAWCRKWTGLYEICWIILSMALIIHLFTAYTVYTLYTHYIHYCIHVLDVLKFFKAALFQHSQSILQ